MRPPTKQNAIMKKYRFTANEIENMKSFILTSIENETEIKTAWRARICYEMQSLCTGTKKSREQGERKLALYKQLTTDDMPNWTDTETDRPCDETTVIFRKYNDGEIIALFPFEPWNYTTCTSYMHMGQHGGADYSGVIYDTQPARPTEYADLLKELQQIGYNNLRILKKRPRTCPLYWPNL